MIKRTNFIASATGMLLAAFSSLPLAQVSEPLASPDAMTLLQRSGFAEQLGWLPDAVAESFDSLVAQDGIIAPFEPDDVPYLQRSIKTVFKADIMQEVVAGELDARLSSDELRYLVGFYDSEQGRVLRKAELDNSILNNTPRFELWFAQGGYHSQTAERQTAVTELEAAMMATEGAVDAMIGMQVAMQVSLTPALPPAEQLSPDQLLLAAQRLRPGLTETYQQSSLETLSFIFKDQTLEDIQAYIRLLNTDAGQRYVRASNDGLNRALFEAAEKLGESIEVLLRGRFGQGV